MLHQQRNQKAENMLSPDVSEIDHSEKLKSVVEDQESLQNPKNSPVARPANETN